MNTNEINKKIRFGTIASLLILQVMMTTTVNGAAPLINDPTFGKTRYNENFDAFLVGTAPSDSWYIVTAAGTGTHQIVTAPAGLTGNSLAATDAAVPYTVHLENTAFGVDLCLSGQVFSFSGTTPDLALLATEEVRVVASGPAVTGPGVINSVFIRFTGIAGTTNNVNYGIRGNTGAEVLATGTGTIVAGSAYTISIAALNCVSGASVQITDTGITGLGPTATAGPASSGIVGTMNGWSIAKTAGTAGTTTVVDDYNWINAINAPPTVTSVTPSSGSTLGGTNITITGTHFQTNSTVNIGSLAATSVNWVNNETLTAITPASTAGTFSVTVFNAGLGNGTLAAAYTYTAAPTPFISSLNPANGTTSGGTNVTITGTNFAAGAQVVFGVVNATSEFFVNSTTMYAISPPQAAGTVGVHVTNTDGQDSVKNYVYDQAIPGTGGGGTGVIETFDNGDSGTTFTEPWYSLAQNVGATVTSSFSSSAPNSLQIAGGLVNMITSADGCANSFEFDLRLSVAPTNTMFIGFHRAVTQSGTNDYRPMVGLLINPDGTVQAASEQVTTNDRRTIAFTPTAGFHHYKMTAICAGGNIQLEYDHGASQLSSIGLQGPLSTPIPYFAIQVLYTPPSFAPPSGTFYVDNIQIGGIDSNGPIAPTHTVTYTALTGFDVDIGGVNAAVRYEGGDKVGTLDGSTLTPSANFIDTNCNRLHGVSAIDTIAPGIEPVISYIQCAGNGTVIEFAIRNALLEAPSMPDYCGDDCTIDIPIGDLAPTNADLNNNIELQDLQEIPYDFSRYNDTQSNSIYYAWAYTTTDGKMGVVTYVANDAAIDRSDFDDEIISAGVSVGQLCTARTSEGPGGQDVIYGGSSSSSVKGFQVNYDFQGQESITDPRQVVVSLSPRFTNAAMTTAPIALGCGASILAVGRADGAVVLFDIEHNTNHILQAAGESPVIARGISVAPSGKWVSFVKSNCDIDIYNTTSYNLAGRLHAPTCTTIRKAEMTWVGEIQYVATNGPVYSWVTSFLLPTGTTPCRACDTDSDGIPNNQDPDIDGDNVDNADDVDIDGDGLCNGNITEDQPPNTNGSGPQGCVVGDDDDDADGILNGDDNQNGTAAGQPGVNPPGTGGGLNDSDTILGINIPRTMEGLNISRASVLLLIAVVIMGAFGIWIYRNTESVIGLIAGILLGFLLAVAMGLIAEWVIITFVLFLLIIFGKMIFGGFYPGSGEE